MAFSAQLCCGKVSKEMVILPFLEGWISMHRYPAFFITDYTKQAIVTCNVHYGRLSNLKVEGIPEV